MRKPVRKAEEVIPTSVYEVKPQQDEEGAPSYNSEETGFKPAFVYVERGPGAGQLVPVRQGITVIGRASVAELRLQHPSISRRHAQIVRKGEFFYIKDLGSQNGTFVNSQRLSTEVEVHPGDEIAVGSALLKLRGPVQAADSAMIPSVKIKAPRKKSSNAVKVALFAGAVGFGLAAMMMFALLRSQQQLPTFKTSLKPKVMVPAPVVQQESNAQANANDVVIAADPVTVKIQQAMAKEQAKEDAKAKEEAAAAPVVAAPVKEEPKKKEEAKTPPSSAVAAAKGELKKANVKFASASASKKSAADEEFEEEDAAPVKKSAPTGANAAQILARYEAGNVGAAIDLAEKAGNNDLLAKLESFQTSYDAAKKAFSGNNAAGAIKNYEKALKLDEQLSSGWGTYGVEIRKQLATIYTLVGNHYASQDNNDEAKKAFNVALKHDPQNAKAKAGLAALGGGSDKAPRAKIADAFEDEEAPAKKTAPKKAPARAAIDDAFGD